MSVIIYKPAGTTIPEDFLKACNDKGGDGIGFTYSKNNKLVTKRNLSFDTFFKEFITLKENSTIIHFASKDSPDEKKTCGPFKLDDNHVLLHFGNLVYDKKSLESPDSSEGYNLCQLIKKFWSEKMFKQDTLKWLLKNNFSSDNKVLIMNNSGEVSIINELTYQGCHRYGAWVSSPPNIGFNNNWSPRGNTTTLTPPSLKNKVEYPILKQIGSPAPRFLNCQMCERRIDHLNVYKFNGMEFCYDCNKDYVLEKKHTESKRQSLSQPENFDFNALIHKGTGYAAYNNFFQKECNVSPTIIHIFDMF